MESKMAQIWLLLWTLLLCDLTEAQLGLLCSKDSDCKMSSSFTCGKTKSCVCQRGYKFDILKLGCAKYLVSYQDKCDPIRDICTGGSNSICASNFLGEKPVCQCKPGYVFDSKTKLCQTKEFISNNNHDNNQISSGMTLEPEDGLVLPGGTCTTNKDCRGFPNATCYSYVTSGKRQCDCSFDSHYYEAKLKRCLPRKDYGSSCDNVEQCVNLQNIGCSSSNTMKTLTCSCKMNFYYDRNQNRCLPSMNMGENCNHDQQCKARPHSYCTRQGNKGQLRCSCLPGKEYYEAAATCVDMTGKIKPGYPCKTSDQCFGGSHAACLSIFLGAGPICACEDGYVFDDASSNCLKQGDKPGHSSQTNDSPSSSNVNQNINLKFDIMIKVSCDSAGQCKTLNSTVLQTQR